MYIKLCILPGVIISIPKWSDFSLSSFLLDSRTLSISIPKWSDFSCFTDHLLPGRADISIPKLSDFSKTDGKNQWLEYENFNPKMV